MAFRTLIILTLSIFAAAAQAATVTDRSAVGELAFWNSVKDTGNASDIKIYIDEFPNGMFIDPAVQRYGELTGQKLASLPEENEVQAVEPAKPVMSKPKTATKKQIFKRPFAGKKKAGKPAVTGRSTCKSGVVKNGKCLTSVAVKKKQVIRSGNDTSSHGGGGGDSGNGGGWN
jgi:hypothetical protein